MDRLIKTEFPSLKACNKCVEFDECMQKQCIQVYDALLKLKHYEDLESQLQKVYGECDGLLEESVRYLAEHEGIDLDNPGKARLLTDGSVDKWLRWKELDKDGRLLELPCKVGDKYYTLDLPIIEYPEKCKECKYFRKKSENPGDYDCLFYDLDYGKIPKCLIIVEREFKRLRSILSFMENGFQGHMQFLNREDVEKALEEMKNDGE